MLRFGQVHDCTLYILLFLKLAHKSWQFNINFMVVALFLKADCDK